MENATDLQINPTFGVSQQVEIPPVPVAPPVPPAVNLQQVYDPNGANIINGNEASFAQQNPNAAATGTTANIVNGNPLNGAPVYTANAHDSNPDAAPNNPNARLAKQAADPKKAQDPKSEVNQGGNQSHTVTNKEIQELEKQTNLTLYPYMFGGELARIKHQFSNLNQNKYYLLLNMLVYGFDNKILQSGAYGSEKYVIDQAFLGDFLRMAKIPQLQDIIKKTPAYAKGSFDDLGKLGITQANANHLSESPITGPSHEHPNLLTALIEKIHPGAIAQLEGYCSSVRTSAYMSLPKRAFASIQKLVAGINGVIAAFEKIINDIYNGIMYYIQQFFALINGIIAKIQQLLQMVIESIIPLDLICLISLILHKSLTDIPLYSSIMNMSNVMNQATGGLQGYLSQSLGGAGGGLSALANNPFAAASRYLPSQVNQIVQQVNSFNSNPQAFLSTAITNYGYAMAAKQSQGEILNVLTQKLGSNFAAMNPIASILGANPNANGSSLPKASTNLGPVLSDNGKQNTYGQTMDSSLVLANTAGGSIA
jgi:hypothetical protein